MNIDDKLKDLRKSMSEDPFKDLQVNKEKIKQHVRTSTRQQEVIRKKLGKTWIPKTLGIISSILLCSFIVSLFLIKSNIFPGLLSQFNLSPYPQENLNDIINQYLSKEEDTYNVLIIFEDPSRSAIPTNWKIQDEIFEWNVSQVKIGFHLSEKLESRFNVEHTPVALVFSNEDIVYKTYDPEKLIKYFQEYGIKAKRPPKEEIDYNLLNINIAGIDLGMSRKVIIDRLGKPDAIEEGADSNILYYIDSGNVVVKVKISHFDIAYSIEAYPSNIKSEKWRKILPQYKNELVEFYDFPEELINNCNNQNCHEYGPLQVIFGEDGSKIIELSIKK